MKRITFLFLFIAAGCSNKLHHEKGIRESLFINSQLIYVYDSLLKQHKDYKAIVKEFEEGLLTQVDNSLYPKEVIRLNSGKLISFATSNNIRVNEILNRLPQISPVEMLVELRNIEGEIKFQREIITENWIKREHFPGLLELAEVDVKVPMISLISGFPDGSDCIQEDCLLKASYAKTHITLGYEALHMMKLYLRVGGGYPPDIRNDLNLIRKWYNSGQPQEDYKKMLESRIKN